MASTSSGLRYGDSSRFGVVAKPHPRVVLEAAYSSFWLAHRRDGLYNAAGALVARIPSGAPDAHVAQEVDVQVAYTLRDGIALGAGYGHWIPGAFWKAATPGSAQDFVYTQITYRF